MAPDLSGCGDVGVPPGRASQPYRAWQLALPAAAEAAGLARRATRDALTAWRMTCLEDPAVLLVSELVTNAVLHARASAMLLRLETAGSSLRIEVHDASPSWPQPRTPSRTDESGFGFLLVEALADKWGVRDIPPGKAVWAELEARPDGDPGTGANQ